MLHIKKLLVAILLFLPVLLFGQDKDPGIKLIDSLESEAQRLPDTKNSKGALLAEIGRVYRGKGSNPKAIEYYLKALKVFESTGNKRSVARVSGNIGSAYLLIASGAPEAERGSLHKAIDYLNRCVSLAADNGYADVLDTFNRDLSVALAMLGSTGTTVSSAQDTGALPAMNESINVQIANTGIVIDENADQKQLAKNKKEKWYYIGGISILIIVLVVVVFSTNWIYKKQKGINDIVSKEKKKAEELLLNILPEKAAIELRDKGMVHPHQFDNVTVLITDFVGFTTAAEQFSPKQLVGELHTCFKAFDGMLDKYGVEKIKTIGDAYLAVAGLPVANTHHAVNAVELALKMRDFMLYRKTQLGDATFEMRIGVHSGSVVAGVVGSKKFAYDIWGDTVNLAARMEQNSVSGKINISQSTYDLVKDKFHCEHRGEIDAKNKGKLNMYYVLDWL